MITNSTTILTGHNHKYVLSIVCDNIIDAKNTIDKGVPAYKKLESQIINKGSSKIIKSHKL